MYLLQVNREVPLTLIRMIQGGSYVNIVIMMILFIVIGIMISVIGKGIVKRDAQSALPASAPVEPRTGNNSAVTAAIFAAVKTYKKNN